MHLRSFFQTDTDTAIDSPRSPASAGLTLIEVIVAVGIIVIVSGFVFTQRSSFSKSINLSNVTQEVAVVLRQAQVYGISNRSSNFAADTEDFSYGVYFDTTASQQLILFRDESNDNGFQSSELVEEYQLPAAMEVTALCTEVDTDGTCTSGSISDGTVMFRRPNPDAFFYEGGGDQLIRDQLVIVLTDNDKHRTITVGTTGFISIN